MESTKTTTAAATNTQASTDHTPASGTYDGTSGPETYDYYGLALAPPAPHMTIMA